MSPSKKSSAKLKTTTRTGTMVANTKDGHSKHKGPCHLLDTPCEVRLRIYDYMIANDVSESDHTLRTPLHNPLLETCKMIRREASPEFDKALEQFHDKLQELRVHARLQRKMAVDATAAAKRAYEAARAIDENAGQGASFMAARHFQHMMGRARKVDEEFDQAEEWIVQEREKRVATRRTLLE